MNDIKIGSITRLIAHDIYPKTTDKDAYAVTRSFLLECKESEKEILVQRIEEALANTIKTFQLDYIDKPNNSIYAFLQKISTIKEKDFIKESITMADELAASHYKTNIPGGYCLIGHGILKDKNNFFFVIKAELQKGFKIEKHILKLTDVFLSPAKDFYKIGFFIGKGKSYTPFMYDDQFSLQKKKLTEYFYGEFLGLTTDKNDKLKSKNFYDEIKNFIEKNINGVPNKLGVFNALTVLFREDSSGIISAKKFSTDYIDENLKAKFEKKVIKKFPLSFTKDISLFENKLQLQRITIALKGSISITGNSSELEENMQIFDNPNGDTLRILEPVINSGQLQKVITIK